MYASTSSTLVVIGVIGNTQTVRDRERREKERVSIIVHFLLNLTGTEAFTPLFSAHNLLHKGID